MRYIYLKKNIISLIIILTVIFSFITITTTISYAADDYEYEDEDEEKPNIFIRMLTYGFRVINKGLYKLFETTNLSIDNLVYNNAPEGEGSNLVGLSLFKEGAAQDFLATFYNIFIYISMAMFIPIVLWTGSYFSKAGDNPQYKSMLKDRLNRVVVTFLLINIMPELLAVMVSVSNALVELFKGVGISFMQDVIGGNTSELVHEYIYNNDGSIIETITGLILIGINIWIVIFYIIRDITVSFLFMIFPLLAITYPLEKGVTKNWIREMAGNIFTQPIQALTLTMVLALGKTIGIGNSSSLVGKVYTLVAFCSVIFMTNVLKNFLGLETGLGAGRSRAGLGGLFSAMYLARNVKQGMQSKISDVREGLDMLSKNRIEDKLEEKNIGSNQMHLSHLDKPVTNLNPPNLNNIPQSIDRKTQNRVARKQIAKGLAGVTAGAVAGITGGTMMMGLGARESVAMASMGMGLGSAAGSALGGGTYNVADAAWQFKQQSRDINEEMKNVIEEVMADNEMVNNLKALQIDEIAKSDLNEEEKNERISQVNRNINNYMENKANTQQFIDNLKSLTPDTYGEYRKRAENRYFGLDNKILNNTEFQEQERKALKTKKMHENLGTGAFMRYAANKSYANLTPQRKSIEELQQIDNAFLYQDKEHSVVYTLNDTGNVEDILYVGKGNPTIENYIDNIPVTFTSENIEIPQYTMLDIEEEAHIEARKYVDQIYAEKKEIEGKEIRNIGMENPEYRRLFEERKAYYKRLKMEEHRKHVNELRRNTGSPIINYKNDELKMKEALEKRMVRLEKEIQDLENKRI